MIEITESNRSIQNKINIALAQEINLILQTKKSSIEDKCKNLATQWILSEPEMLSLQTGIPESLAGQFGLVAGTEVFAAQDIAKAVGDSVFVQLKKFDNKLNGGLYINFQPNSFLNLLGLDSGHTIYPRGDLHWLEWLLTKGDSIIVVNYSYNPKSGLGRSQLGNMIESTSGSFRVPPEFSGTVDNNFVTRALIGRSQEDQIQSIIYGVLA
tara:strand:+ start:1597 stop:2229 length:633 start_codon:yes stop_codon:yes gene_type:complete